MTRMTGMMDCAVMCNLINIVYTHAYTLHIHTTLMPLGRKAASDIERVYAVICAIS